MNSWNGRYGRPVLAKLDLWIYLLFFVLLVSTPARAIEPPEPGEQAAPQSLKRKQFSKQELRLSVLSEPIKDIAHKMPKNHAAARQRFSQRHGKEFDFHIDPRSGTPTNIVGSIPIIPGSGSGNSLTKKHVGDVLGETVSSIDSKTVAKLTRKFLHDNIEVLNLDESQIGEVTAEQVSDHLWQVHASQQVNGVPVRRARLAATINNGNLVMLGTERWGDVRIGTTPDIKAADAMRTAFEYADGKMPGDEVLSEPKLEIVSTAPLLQQEGDRFVGNPGQGYEHRLVWVFTFKRPSEVATWEAMIDANTGEVVSFQDINQYLTTSITGGTYPVTNTGVCTANSNCGSMQLDQPMPFADTGLPAPYDFTNSAGLFDYTSGLVTTKLSGKYVEAIDWSCGTINESALGGISLGGSNGDHDCASGGASAGNDAATRTSFYELNRIQEMARGYLPGNSWLNGGKGSLISIVNLTSGSCNAYWSGGAANFYKGGNGCRNAGEIAGILDHEWAHGLDENDVSRSFSSPSEAYGDIATIYRLQKSCVGDGLFQTRNKGCGLTADGTGYNTIQSQNSNRCALDCSGVRETDWEKLIGPANTPDTASNFTCPLCSNGTTTSDSGPCGKQVHCESIIDTESAWDFAARDLQAAPYNYDANTAFMIANRIFYQGSGNIGNWHTCSCAGSISNGCGASNAYMQWLAADDDDGNLSNGTPHMTALFNAFNRHGIACATPAPVNSGCAGRPVAAPEVTVTPADGQMGLSWSPVAGAAKYAVYRSEGVTACDSGKTLIGTVTGETNTAYSDTGLANGRQYCYTVTAVGSSDRCSGSASACVCATYQAAGDPEVEMLALASNAVSVQAGGVLSISDTVRNNGAGVANNAEVSFSLVDANNVPTSIGSRTVGYLAPGASSPRTMGVTIPASTPLGLYSLCAQATTNKDLNTGNNLLCSSSQIEVTPYGPDLTLASLSGTASGVTGGQYRVDYTVVNNSASFAAGGFVVAIRLSTDSVCTDTDPLLGTYTHYSGLAAGKSEIVKATVPIPADKALGDYYVCGFVDSNNQVIEYNENNNSLTGNQMSVSSGFDFTMTGEVIGPVSGLTGGRYTVNNTVQNNGSGTGYASVRIYLSADSVCTASDTWIGSRYLSLAPGAVSVEDTQVLIDTAQPVGTYYLCAIVDPSQSVTETDESNNSLTGNQINISKAPIVDLTVTADGPTSGVTGAKYSVSSTVTNSGSSEAGPFKVDILLSTSNQVCSGAVIGTRLLTSVAARGASTDSTEVFIPTGQATGTYYLCAFVDSDNSVIETLEGNNKSALKQIVISSGVDLIMTDLQGPTLGEPGGRYTVSSTVGNIGGGQIGWIYSANIYLSADMVCSTSDTYVGYNASFGDLAAGESRRANSSVLIPATLAPGTYYYCGIVNPYNHAESDKTNNTFIGNQIVVSAYTAPSIATASPLSPGTAGAAYSQQLTVAGGAAPFTWSATGLPAGLQIDASTGVVSGITTAIGVANVTVQVVDAKNATASKLLELTINPSPVSITAPAAGAISTRTPLLSFSAQSADTAVVKVDGVVLGKTSGDTLGPLGDGSHTVRVETMDASGTSVIGFAEVAFTVTATTPTITITSPTTGVSSDRTPPLSFTVSEGTPIVKVDGLVAAKVSGDLLDTLADGLHTIEVESTNAIGYRGFAKVSFVVDGAAPAVTIASPAAGFIAVKTPTLSYSVSDGSVVVKVDGAVVQKVSGDALSLLPDGLHVVRVEATNAAGKKGFSESSFTVKYQPQFDLQIGAVSGTITGGNLSYSVQVKNVGSDTAPASSVELYLAASGTVTPSDLRLVTRPTISIPAGGEQILTGTLALPSTTQPATYYVAAVVDSANLLQETDETNNGGAGNQVTVAYDLTISGLTGTLTGGVLTYTVKVKNLGNGNPSSSTALYLSTDAVVTTADNLVIALPSTSIPGGTEKTFTGTVTLPALPSGTYYLAALADRAGTVVETDESNNGAIAEQFLLNSDLRIGAVSGTVAGGILNYTVTVSNVGNVTAATSTTGLYLAAGSTVSVSDLRVGTLGTLSLAAGAERVLTGSVTLLSTIPPGTYSVGAIADATNVVIETDETNNGGVGNQVTVANDLTVTALTGTLSGGALTYTVKVKNNGNGNSTSSAALYFSADAVATTADYQVIALATTSIPGGTEKTFTGTVIVPGTIPSGSYYLAAVADRTGTVVETDETNNGAVAEQFALNTDLRIVAVSGTVAGGSLTYSVTVANAGNIAAAASTTGLYLPAGSTVTASDFRVGTVSTQSIPAGTERIVTGKVTLPYNTPPGTFSVGAIADTTNVVKESDETNNGGIGNQVTVANDLSISGLTGTLSGGVLTYTVTVKNSGNGNPSSIAALYFSADAVASTADYLVISLASTTIPSGTEKTFTGTVTVPGTIPSGTYYLAAVADRAGTVVETDETNNGAVAEQFALNTELRVSAVSGTVSGGTLTYSVTLTNAGNIAAAASSTGLYLVTGSTVSLTDLRVGTLSTQSIAAGADRVLSGTVVLSSTVPPGNYQVAAIADTANIVKESDETNNGTVGNTVTR